MENEPRRQGNENAIKVPLALKRELKKAAKSRGVKPSAAARAFLEEGIARHKPGGLLCAGRSLVRADRIDPSTPAFKSGWPRI
jgi:hypothetical protein